MPRRVPASLREGAAEAEQSRSAPKRSTASNDYMQARRREVYVLLGFIGATAVLSALVLRAMGLIGPGSWEDGHESRVNFLSGSPNVLDEFLRTRQTDKVAVAFYSHSCPHCKRMRAPFLACSRELTDITFVGINAVKNRELAARYNLEVVPSVLWFASGSKTDSPVVYPGQPNQKELSDFLVNQLAKARGEDGSGR